VLVQSRPLHIAGTLGELEHKTAGLLTGLAEVTGFARRHNIRTYPAFTEKAGTELLGMMGNICSRLQEALKIAGDWQIYPLAVHDLIARGRVEVAERTVYLDGKEMPAYGYRIDEYE
jgi:hypothetical protein